MTIDYDMASADYFALDRLSSSGCKSLLASPERFAWERSNPSESTPAMRFGTLVHCLVLEPSDMHARYLVRPDGIDRRTKEGKIAWEAFESTVAGREVVDGDDWRRAHDCAAAVAAELARCGVALGPTEVSINWDADVPLKARCDALLVDGVLDLKTTSGPLDDDSLAKACWNFRYDLSMAHYLDACAKAGLPCERAVLAFVQTSAPYCVRVVELDHDALAVGIRDRDRAVSVYQECQAFGFADPWRGKVSSIGLPRWAGKESK